MTLSERAERSSEDDLRPTIGSSGLRRAYDAHGEKLRFLIVGVFNTAFGYALFVAMLWLLEPPLKALDASPVRLFTLASANYFLIAQWTSWVLAVPVGATTMGAFAFRSTGNRVHQILRSYLVYLPGLGISSGLLWLTVRVLHMPPQLGQLVTIAIATIFSYVGHKYFTFRTRSDPAPQDL